VTGARALANSYTTVKQPAVATAKRDGFVECAQVF
jgi:hypothetical protein